MSFSIECTFCGKSYKVADEMAGRRVKCKSCGEVFRIPQQQAADDLLDLNALAALEAQAAPMPEEPGRKRFVGSHGVPPTAAPTAGGVSYARVAPKPRGLRPPGPHEDLLHNKLPIALVFFGYVVPLGWSLVNAFRAPQPVWSVLGVLAGIALVIGVVIPITVVGLKIASRIMHFELVASPGFRVLAAFSAAPLVTWIFVLFAEGATAHGNPMDMLIAIVLAALLGFALGLLASFFVLWLLFRLDFLGALVAWLLSIVAYVVGSAASIGVLILASLLISYIYVRVGGHASHSTAGGGSWLSGGASADYYRQRSGSNLRQIGAAMQMYSNQDHLGRYPPTVGPDNTDLTESVFSSPIAHASSGPDYVYRYADGMNNCLPPNYVVAYDEGALEQGEGTEVLFANDTAAWVPKDQFDAIVADGDRAKADAAARQAASYVESPARQAQEKELRDQMLAAQEAAARRARLSVAPNASTVVRQPVAISPPVAPPAPPILVVPANAWHAEPDPPAVRPLIRPTLRQIFPRHAHDLLYPLQPSTYACIGDELSGPATTPNDVHEIWNLKTMTRTGYINGQLSLGDPIISPDGQFLAGRITGGQGQASTFEVWSFKTGKSVQVLADAPMTQSGVPVAIGFLGADRLVTLDDGLRIWDIKSGALTRRADLDVKRGPNELVAISATGKLVALLDADQKLALIDAVTGNDLGDTPIPQSASPRSRFFRGQAQALAFSPDGNELALLLNSVERRIVVWSVARGNVLANLTLSVSRGVGAVHSKSSPLVWLPDSDGWLIDGDQIVDRATGVVLYEVPEHREPMAEEFGPRKVLDASHILMSFKSFSKGMGMETFPLPAAVIAKARAASNANGN